MLFELNNWTKKKKNVRKKRIKLWKLLQKNIEIMETIKISWQNIIEINKSNSNNPKFFYSKELFWEVQWEMEKFCTNKKL